MNTFLMSLVLLWAPWVPADVRYPARPGPREFIQDEAKLLSAEDAAAVKALCDEALTKKRAPIVVLTISSLDAYGAAGWPIDRYAMNVMSEWGEGWEDWNYGMLLLVSRGDRKARIELGASWARRKDDDARRIMGQRIIPNFKEGNYSKGILEGVRGLHDIALDAVPARRSRLAPGDSSAPPSAPPGAPPSQRYAPPDFDASTPPGSARPSSGGGILSSGLVVIVLIVLGFLVLRLIFRALSGGMSSWGSSGPGYYGGGYYGGDYYGGGPFSRGGFGSSFGGGLLGGALGSILADQYNRRNSPSYPAGGSGPTSGPSYSPPSSTSDSGGGSGGDDPPFGGGSFGGGFSGGGGASGEW